MLKRHFFDSKEYAVAPATVIVAGVLNGHLVPADEIAAFVEAWNGRPIPVHHPYINGQPVSANHPEIIEKAVVGNFYNARMEGDALKGELWLEVEKVHRIGGDAVNAFDRMDAGELVELSTGYFHDIEPKKGRHKGKVYNGVHRNIRPDHIALLPNERGARSVADGCGAPRIHRGNYG
jgi:hypothetical protein